MKLPGNLTNLFTPGALEGELQTQRERILFNILVGMSILGGMLLSVATFRAILDQDWRTLSVYISIYIWTLVITFFRRIPYTFRVYSLLSIIFILGLASNLKDGLEGSGRLYLLAFAIIGGTLLGTRVAIGSILLSGITLAAIYYSRLQGILPIPVIEPYEYTSPSIGFSLLTMVGYLAVGITTSISMVTLLSSLNRSLAKEQNMRTDLVKERLSLDNTVQRRTQDLERRLVQIRTAAEISRALSAVLDQQVLLQKVVNLLKDGFQLYYVGVFLIDETGQFAVLRAGTGGPGEKMIAEGHKLAVGGGSMVGWSTANKKARIALDVGQEAVRFSNPHLPLTRSELALPLVSAERALGAITIQSVSPQAFDEDDITVMQGAADSLATALENARLFRQVQGSLEEIRTLHQQYLVQAWGDVPKHEGGLSFSYGTDDNVTDKPVNTVELPMTLRNQTIGVLKFEGDRMALTTEEKAFIEAVTNEAAVALENVRLLGETKRRAERERLIAEVASRVRASTEVDAVLQTALRETGRILRASRGEIKLDFGGFENQDEKADQALDDIY